MATVEEVLSWDVEQLSYTAKALTTRASQCRELRASAGLGIHGWAGTAQAAASLDSMTLAAQLDGLRAMWSTSGTAILLAAKQIEDAQARVRSARAVVHTLPGYALSATGTVVPPMIKADDCTSDDALAYRTAGIATQALQDADAADRALAAVLEGIANPPSTFEKISDETWRKVDQWVDEHQNDVKFFKDFTGTASAILTGLALISLGFFPPAAPILEGASLYVGAVSLGTSALLAATDPRDNASGFAVDALSMAVGSGGGALAVRGIGKVEAARALTPALQRQTLGGYKRVGETRSLMEDTRYIGQRQQIAGRIVQGESASFDGYQGVTGLRSNPVSPFAVAK